MSEPEELLIQAAIRVTSVTRELWRRHSPEPERPRLKDSRIRVEWLLSALYSDPPPIRAAEPPPWVSALTRFFRRIPPFLVQQTALAATDGATIFLPASLDESVGYENGIKHYQLLALEQAARVARGSAAFQPDGSARLPHVLYALAEAVAVDRELAATLPGLVDTLRQARGEALLRRPPAECLKPSEQAVELWLREALGAAQGATLAWAPVDDSPLASREWAIARASELAKQGVFRGLPAVALWGRFETASDASTVHVLSSAEEAPAPRRPQRVGQMPRRPRVRQSQEGEDDERPGAFIVKADDAEQSVEDPLGLQRPADREVDVDANELGDSLSELPEARVVRTRTVAKEVLLGNDPPDLTAKLPATAISATGFVYPEWDYRRNLYRPRGAIVRETSPTLGPLTWSTEVLERHAPLVQEVRRRFARLRPHRLRLGRQLEGGEIDLDAFVAAQGDRQAGSESDDRLYESVRPRRRDLAVCLLVDISASTDSWVTARQRIIDVEKEALLVVCEALTALGDRYAILAFSGDGPEAVNLFPVKRFDEPQTREILRRIAGLEPERFTRVGAAVRHATALLAEQRARHRVLLVLSDGKPNDEDEYEGRYGVEDARQAVCEARRQEVSVVCLTVDRQAPAYVPRIFGPGAYSVLRRPELLPRVLVDLMRRLVMR